MIKREKKMPEKKNPGRLRDGVSHLPQPVSVLLLPDGRRALVLRLAILDLLGGEEEVMGTRLSRDALPSGARVLHHLQAVRV